MVGELAVTWGIQAQGRIDEVKQKAEVGGLSVSCPSRIGLTKRPPSDKAQARSHRRQMATATVFRGFCAPFAVCKAKLHAAMQEVGGAVVGLELPLLPV